VNRHWPLVQRVITEVRGRQEPCLISQHLRMNRHQRRANAKLGHRSDDPTAAGLLELGLKHHQAGKLAEAEQCYRQILSSQPNHADAIQLIGAIAYQAGQYDVAIEWIGRAIRLNANNAGWFSNLGLALERQGRFDEAVASHDAALRLKPDFVAALNNRGNAQRALGRLDEALASYDAALALDPNFVDAWNNLGNVLQMGNRLDEALACFDKALQLRPDYIDAFVNRGNALRQLNRSGEALSSYDAAVALNPNLAAVLNNRGMILKELDRLDDALASFDEALALNPDFAEAYNNRGVLLAARGRRDEALVSYDRALALDPERAPILNNRGNLLQEMRRIDEALADYDKALAVDPGDADAVNGRGSALLKLNRLDESERTVRRAIELKPDYAEAYCNLGLVHIELGRLAEAEALVRRAVALKPDSVVSLCALAKVLVDLGRVEESEVVIRRAVALKPDHAEAHFNLGNVLIKLGRPGEAEAATREAIALDPGLAGAHHNLGVVLMELGRLPEARAAAELAVSGAPREPLHFRQLGEVRKYLAGDPFLTALEALSEDEASLPIAKRIDLNFAMAKAHADLGQIDEEFRRLLAGNKLKRGCFDYDEASVLGDLDRAQQLFSPDFMRAARGAGEPSAKPIFILGMPRSGTSLVEQILASHPQVVGGGELTLFERMIGEIRSGMGPTPDYPDLVLQMSERHFRELGRRYLAGIASLAPAASHVTDKMPANFVFAGLIHLALPDATIIHTVRDPVDTCISCFSKLFTEGNFQTYDLAELGRYYRHYQSLMAHWHRVLPEGRILDVNYEETVADLEATARRIVAHCGLPWDPRCLDFHRTDRVVRTSSATQVRQPIYASSVGRRHRYGSLLAPLLAELPPPA
jgi:tetratricopeptide (TPR) repeat protein